MLKDVFKIAFVAGVGAKLGSKAVDVADCLVSTVLEVSGVTKKLHEYAESLGSKDDKKPDNGFEEVK